MSAFPFSVHLPQSAPTFAEWYRGHLAARVRDGSLTPFEAERERRITGDYDVVLRSPRRSAADSIASSFLAGQQCGRQLAGRRTSPAEAPEAA